MRIHLVTLFPRALSSYFSESIMKRAQESNAFSLRVYNLADYSVWNTRRSDDRPYGGFPGTVLAPEPLERVIEAIRSEEPNIRWIVLDPRGETLCQEKLETLARPEAVYGILCGHYEGIDERVLEYYGVEKISLGKFVITSGELAAAVLIDGIVRLLPGVLSDESLKEESFSRWLSGKKEYPHYTRPSLWKWLSVPEELLSGDPKRIQAWKQSHIQQ